MRLHTPSNATDFSLQCLLFQTEGGDKEAVIFFRFIPFQNQEMVLMGNKQGKS